MEFRHLRYFVVLADELHFGRAAKRLAISQPPLSLNIKQLEDSLGAVLFDRTNKSVQLTPAGIAFRDIALRLLAEADQGTEVVRQIAKGIRSRIRVGIVGSMLFRGLPEQLAAFQKAHTDVEVVLTELNSAEQIEALVRRDIDLGFVHSDRVPRPLEKMLYLSEPFVCCVPVSHRAARQRSIELHALSGEPMVMFSRAASPDYYERILALCLEHGLQPTIRHEVRHWLSVVSLVSKEMGIALVPQTLRSTGIAGVRFLTIPPSRHRSEAYCVWSGKNMPALLPALIDSIRPNHGDQA